jgi:hypothetical protein
LAGSSTNEVSKNFAGYYYYKTKGTQRKLNVSDIISETEEDGQKNLLQHIYRRKTECHLRHYNINHWGERT